MSRDRLRILLVASEVAPFAKTGGLADVTGALPRALAALGHDVRVLLPKYRGVEATAGPLRLAWRVGGVAGLPVSLDALAVDAGGRVYLVDRNTNAVHLFTAEGAPLGLWRALAVGGLHTWLAGIAVAPPDRLILVDRSCHCLRVVDRSGRPLETWGEKGAALGQFFNPHAAAVGPTGTVYVTDLGNARIQSFTPTGGLGASWEGFTDEAALRHPTGLAVDGAGRLYIGDTDNHRVVVLSPGLDLLAVWGRFGRGPTSPCRSRSTSTSRPE